MPSPLPSTTTLSFLPVCVGEMRSYLKGSLSSGGWVWASAVALFPWSRAWGLLEADVQVWFLDGPAPPTLAEAQADSSSEG